MVEWIVRSSWALSKYYSMTLTLVVFAWDGTNSSRPHQCATHPSPHRHHSVDHQKNPQPPPHGRRFNMVEVPVCHRWQGCYHMIIDGGCTTMKILMVTLYNAAVPTPPPWGMVVLIELERNNHVL